MKATTIDLRVDLRVEVFKVLCVLDMSKIPIVTAAIQMYQFSTMCEIHK